MSSDAKDTSSVSNAYLMLLEAGFPTWQIARQVNDHIKGIMRFTKYPTLSESEQKTLTDLENLLKTIKENMTFEEREEYDG